MLDELKEVKIYVTETGALVAVLPDGQKRDILVDVHDLGHYGMLRIRHKEKAVPDYRSGD